MAMLNNQRVYIYILMYRLVIKHGVVENQPI